MSAIKTILLIPHDGDPHGLLAEGPCGARPPTMERDRNYTDWPISSDPPPDDPHWWADWSYVSRDNVMAMHEKYGADYQHALVLAWKGQAVWQGIVPAQALLRTSRDGGLLHAVRATLRDGRPARLQRKLAPVGTPMCLDADGQEVKP